MFAATPSTTTLLSFPHRWSRRRLSSLQPTDEARKEKQRRKAGARAPKLYTILHNYYGVGGGGLAARAAAAPRVVQKAKEAHQVVASSSLLKQQQLRRRSSWQRAGERRRHRRRGCSLNPIQLTSKCAGERRELLHGNYSDTNRSSPPPAATAMLGD